MLSGATCSAVAIVGTAVFKIVVSSDSIKNATAISHGTNRLLDSPRGTCGPRALLGSTGFTFFGFGGINLRIRVLECHYTRNRLSPIRAAISSKQARRRRSAMHSLKWNRFAESTGLLCYFYLRKLSLHRRDHVRMFRLSRA